MENLEGGHAVREGRWSALEGRHFTLACIAAVLLVGATYSNSLRNAFHFDDSHVIVNNLHIRSLSNIPSFFRDANTFSVLETNAAYRPVVTLSLAVDHALAGGLDPVPYHITQILLLALCGVGLYLLALHLFRVSAPGAVWPRWGALLAATWFCVHTGNSQVGNYISARSESLSALGLLAGLLLYIHVPASRRFHLYLIPVAIGALAKLPAVMFGPILLVYRLFVEEGVPFPQLLAREHRASVRRAVLGVLPAFALAIVLYLFVHWMQPPGVVYGGGGRMEYLITQTWVWVRYVGMFILPVGLSADSDLRVFPDWRDFRVAAGVTLLLVSLAVVWWSSRIPALRAVLAFGILWFWIGLVPSSTIFSFAQITNDHRVFLPFMGLTLATVGVGFLAVDRWTLDREGRRGVAVRAGVSAALVLLAAHAVGTFQRNTVWRSAETLWADVVAKNPANGRSLMNYGLTLMARGELSGARDLFLRAREFTPNYAVLEVNLGIVHGALGDSVTADAHFNRALHLAPQFAGAHRFYANWLAERGRGPEAVDHLEQALTLAPGDGEVRQSLMGLLAARGDSLRLREVASGTLEIAPTDGASLAFLQGGAPLEPPPSGVDGWFAAGLDHTRRERFPEAAQAYRQVLRADPSHSDAWNNLGWVLGQMGFLDEALMALEAAVALRPEHERARNNLAAMREQWSTRTFDRAVGLQRAGDLDGATELYRKLLVVFPDWVNARFNLGHALMTTNQCTLAIPEFERVLSLQPSFEAARLHLSTCRPNEGTGPGSPDTPASP